MKSKKGSFSKKKGKEASPPPSPSPSTPRKAVNPLSKDSLDHIQKRRKEKGGIWLPLEPSKLAESCPPLGETLPKSTNDSDLEEQPKVPKLRTGRRRTSWTNEDSFDEKNGGDFVIQNPLLSYRSFRAEDKAAEPLSPRIDSAPLTSARSLVIDKASILSLLSQENDPPPLEISEPSSGRRQSKEKSEIAPPSWASLVFSPQEVQIGPICPRNPPLNRGRPAVDGRGSALRIRRRRSNSQEPRAEVSTILRSESHLQKSQESDEDISKKKVILLPSEPEEKRKRSKTSTGGSIRIRPKHQRQNLQDAFPGIAMHDEQSTDIVDRTKVNDAFPGIRLHDQSKDHIRVRPKSIGRSSPLRNRITAYSGDSWGRVNPLRVEIKTLGQTNPLSHQKNASRDEISMDIRKMFSPPGLLKLEQQQQTSSPSSEKEDLKHHSRESQESDSASDSAGDSEEEEGEEEEESAEDEGEEATAAAENEDEGEDNLEGREQFTRSQPIEATVKFQNRSHVPLPSSSFSPISKSPRLDTGKQRVKKTQSQNVSQRAKEKSKIPSSPPDSVRVTGNPLLQMPPQKLEKLVGEKGFSPNFHQRKTSVVTVGNPLRKMPEKQLEKLVTEMEAEALARDEDQNTKVEEGGGVDHVGNDYEETRVTIEKIEKKRKKKTKATGELFDIHNLLDHAVMVSQVQFWQVGLKQPKTKWMILYEDAPTSSLSNIYYLYFFSHLNAHAVPTSCRRLIAFTSVRLAPPPIRLKGMKGDWLWLCHPSENESNWVSTSGGVVGLWVHLIRKCFQKEKDYFEGAFTDPLSESFSEQLGRRPSISRTRSLSTSSVPPPVTPKRVVDQEEKENNLSFVEQNPELSPPSNPSSLQLTPTRTPQRSKSPINRSPHLSPLSSSSTCPSLADASSSISPTSLSPPSPFTPDSSLSYLSVPPSNKKKECLPLGLPPIKSVRNGRFKSRVRHKCRLNVFFHQAKKLKRKGGPRPYVVLHAFGRQMRTRTVWRDGKDAFWNEKIIIEMENGATPSDLDRAIVYVMHDSEIEGKDELLGECDLDLLAIKKEKTMKEELHLSVPEKRKFLDGMVQLRMGLRKKPTKIGIGKTVTGFLDSHLRVSVIQASRLPLPPLASPGVFVRVQFGKSSFRTKLVRRSTNPIFGDHFEFLFDGSSVSADGDPQIELSAFYQDSLGHDVLLGTSNVSFILNGSFEDEVEQPPQDFWVTLENPEYESLSHSTSSSAGNEKGRGGGTLSVTASWETIRILEKRFYHNFSQLLLASPTFPAIRALASIKSDDLESLSSSFVALLLEEKRALHFFTFQAQFEIKQTPNRAVLFRGNTLLTKSMDQLQKKLCARYVREVLHNWLHEVYEEKQSMELDPLRSDIKQNDFSINRAHILIYTQRLLNILFQSVTRVPSVLKALFNEIRQCAQKKFGEDGEMDEVQFTSVSSFFFLRLICPALLSPVQFQITSKYPSARATRALTLIAKLLQNLANLALFGFKEPYMEPLNPFLMANFNRMKTFLHSICQHSGKICLVSSLSDDSHSSYNHGIHLCRLHSLASSSLEEVQSHQFESGELRQAQKDLISAVKVLNRESLRARATPEYFHP